MKRGYVVRKRSDMENKLFAIGDPLLDVIAEVDRSFLEKYLLGSDAEILSGKQQTGLYDDLLRSYHVDYVPGGSEQNCMRMVQVCALPYALLKCSVTLNICTVGRWQIRFTYILQIQRPIDKSYTYIHLVIFLLFYFQIVFFSH